MSRLVLPDLDARTAARAARAAADPAKPRWNLIQGRTPGSGPQIWRRLLDEMSVPDPGDGFGAVVGGKQVRFAKVYQVEEFWNGREKWKNFGNGLGARNFRGFAMGWGHQPTEWF